MTDGGPTLEPLGLDDCHRLLRESHVGRVAVVVHDFPVILPVNYRFVETSGPTWVVLRTRAGGLLEQAPMPAAFEIDAIDEVHHAAWSVLVRGTLQRIDPEAADFGEHFDPEPWAPGERDVWMAIEPFFITGRRLAGGERSWAFQPEAYL
jgi:nitroimidazol reductase NimA-like FMN-containing flavoprotein (pyridoxamine 5'-phosphate oxidase superfamily)